MEESLTPEQQKWLDDGFMLIILTDDAALISFNKDDGADIQDGLSNWKVGDPYFLLMQVKYKVIDKRTK